MILVVAYEIIKFLIKLLFFQPNQGVAMRVAQWENRLEERSTQIFQTLQKKKEELKQEAEKVDEKQEEVWREQGKIFFSL